jgi:hypothetical protein
MTGLQIVSMIDSKNKISKAVVSENESQAAADCSLMAEDFLKVTLILTLKLTLTPTLTFSGNSMSQWKTSKDI